ncbi:hypothetical protein GALL_169390 [mine drainage metagenome]|uniref:Uncharacterized protein n=1 Tax=mine drainage metagenome TaxID=410659 RepID=A0A1J5RYI0_9ZZZZ
MRKSQHLTTRFLTVGFTLIEVIMVIAIIGIIAGMVAVFITKPIEGYVDSIRRAELTDAADVALRRLTRDVRLALPNSLRTTAGGIEFIMTKAGGRYRDENDGSTAGNVLSFNNSNTKFDVLGPIPALATGVSGDYIVIYNLGTGYSPADAYAGGNRAQVSSVSGNTITLASNTFANQSPPIPSPNSRFQVVGFSDKVVRYLCNGDGTLTRQSGCDFTTTTNCSSTAVLAGSTTTEPKASCTIDYTSAATGRNGLLYIELTLTDTPSGERVTLFQQIHVDNAP